MKTACAFSVLSLLVAAAATAQPTITSLGGGRPQAVTNNLGGTVYVSGSGSTAIRWSLTGGTLSAQTVAGTAGGGVISSDGRYMVTTVPNTGPQVSGNTATGVSPPFSQTPTLVSAPIAATEFRTAVWDAQLGAFQHLPGLPVTPSLMVYGSGSSGSTSGTFLSGFNMSPNGRFVVGQGYISSYNSAAGTTIALSTFNWRPWVFDTQANGGLGAHTVLPTPMRTSSNLWRRRTGAAYDVSDDGLVICGYQEHNVSTAPAADPDGARPVVWRFNPGTSEYEMTFLPNGVNGSGFAYIASATPGNMHMNAAGTAIVSRVFDNAGNTYFGRWTYDAGTGTWSAPQFVAATLGTPATWLPGSVTGCGVPPNLSVTGVSEDGQRIVGMAVYSTCGSFMSGGWIWDTEANTLVDWYDYLVAEGATNVTTEYGPIGDNGDPTRGLPRLGFPVGVSADGNQIVGFQGGTQLIPGAPGWVVQMTGGPSCVTASIGSQPAAVTNFSACSSSIILSTVAAGTGPFTYQWYKDGMPMSDGTTAQGSVVTGANAYQLRVNPPLAAADAGVYTVVATGACGSATSTDAVVQLDAAFPVAANDTCATAQVVTMGSNVLGAGQSPCGAYATDFGGFASCAPTGLVKADRWFVFTPTVSGNYRFETCGSNFDTLITIAADCGGGEMACNNDYTTGPSSGCTSNRSRIASVALNAGQAYYVRVAAPLAAFLSGTSLMNLSITNAPAPAANDDCANAQPAVVGTNAFDTTEATNDAVASCSTGLSRDVHFTYTPTNAGLINVMTCPGTSYNTVLSILDGCFGVELACNDNASVTGCTNQSKILNFRVDANEPLYFRVGGNNATAFGAGVLTLEFWCYGDYNRDTGVDGDDVIAFFADWDAGLIAADVDGSGGVDGDDVIFFFGYWDSGC